MKSIKLILGFVLMAVLLTAPMSSAELPSGLTVTVDNSHGAFHTSVDYLDGNLTAAGSSLNVLNENSTFDLTGSDVFLSNGNDGEYTQSELDELNSWFTGDGPRLMWVAGDSDFGGYHNFSNQHALLEEAGASLRLASESIEDPVNNDNAAYRVLATNPVSDGVVNSQLTDGVSQMIMHGPTGVVALDNNGDTVRPSTLGNVEVVMQSSADAVALDSDLSETQFDFYSQDDQDAPFPMIAIEYLGDAKWVIVSGEAVFTDYKFMYSGITENGGTQDGKTFVDNVFSWFAANAGSDVIEADQPTTDDELLPFATIAAGSAFAAVALLRRREQ